MSLPFQRQLYTLKVVARDGGSPPRSSVTVVYMNVADVNDNQPQFDPASYHQLLYENARVGTSLLNITATDVDSGQWILTVADLLPVHLTPHPHLPLPSPT